MRNAVEFLGLVCKKTRDSNEDDVSLNFNGATVWPGRIRSDTTTVIDTIKVMPDPTGVAMFWQTDAPSRTLACLGRQTIQQVDTEPGTVTALFTRDGADYTLSYKLLQIPD